MKPGGLQRPANLRLAGEIDHIVLVAEYQRAGCCAEPGPDVRNAAFGGYSEVFLARAVKRQKQVGFTTAACVTGTLPGPSFHVSLKINVAG